MSVVDELLSGTSTEERKMFPVSSSVVDEILSPSTTPRRMVRDETIIETNVLAIGNYNAVATQTESPTFSGTKFQTIVSDGTLRLDSSELFDSATGNFDWNLTSLGFFCRTGSILNSYLHGRKQNGYLHDHLFWP